MQPSTYQFIIKISNFCLDNWAIITGIRIEKFFYKYAPNALIFNLLGFADGKAVFYVFLKNDLKENDDLLSKLYEHALNGEFAFLDDYVQKFFIYDFEKNLIATSTSKKVGWLYERL